MAPVDPGGAAPALGVGMVYTISADRFARTPGALDYWTITPEMFWSDRGAGHPEGRFADLPQWVDALEWAAPRMPLVAHHIGLSIASATPCDAEYLDQIAAWHARWRYPWISDHLSFSMVEGTEGVGSAGIALPASYDEPVLDMVAQRVIAIKQKTGAPFLLENPARYILYPDEAMSEPEFINRLCERTGGGLLLDLHNLLCNAINPRFDAAEWLAAIDLDHVVEIHVAGGAMIGDIYADSHAGACPEAVWSMLDAVVPAARHLRGITFEFHDSYYATLGDAGLEAQIGRAREAWARRPGRGPL
jgi:uncharacterized protein (UPF0276 family)